MKESELAKPVADWLRSYGYTVYSEIPFYCRSIDMVAVGDQGNLCCVELKTSWSRHLLEQCYPLQTVTHLVYGCAPSMPHPKTIMKYVKMGVGMLVYNGTIDVLQMPIKKMEPLKWRAERIRALLNEFEPSDDAGLPNQKGMGPAQEVYERVQTYRLNHPAATWKEVYINVPNYYSNEASLCGAMRKVEERRHNRL